MTNLAQLVPLPPVNSVNRGLSRLRESTVLQLLGVPGNLPSAGDRCGNVTNTKLLELIEKRQIANLQFSTRAPGAVLDLLEEVFADVQRADPELFDKCRTNGSLCCRGIQGSSRPFSNHAWGLAIDLGFQPAGPGEFIAADPRGDGRTELGLLKLIPFFNTHGFFWGGAFSGRSEDSMHFEVSEQLAQRLFSGEGAGTRQRPAAPIPLRHPLLAADPGMQEVAKGARFLQLDDTRSGTVGILQDALNLLGNRELAVPLGPQQQDRGVFDRRTEAAIKKLQEIAGLARDGVVGQHTLGALDKRLSERAGQGELRHSLLRSDPNLQAVASGNLVLGRSGERSASVGAIQDALNLLARDNPHLTINLGDGGRFRGFFGPQTERAIGGFQESAGLPVDGRVDHATVKAIDRALTALPADHGSDAGQTPTIEGPGGYRPPAGAGRILGSIPLRDAQEIEPEDVGIARGQCEILLKLPSGALYFEAGMQTDADGSPRARQIDRFGQLETAFNFAHQSGQARFVDAEAVNDIVLPDGRLNASERFFNRMGIGLGDVAAVIHNGKLEFAMFADIGPLGKLGEGSVHLVQALGVDPFIDGQVRIGIADEVVYLVFPGSRPASLSPDNVNDKVRAAAHDLFKRLGGTVAR